MNIQLLWIAVCSVEDAKMVKIMGPLLTGHNLILSLSIYES